MTQVVVCCGLGGVGKTTTAAALGLGLARQGARVVVLTIDPARRLADALGVELHGVRPQPVPLGRIAVEPGGSLSALMLDRKATWDAVVHRFSPSPEVAERLLHNRYYQAVSTRLTGSHEYMAVEMLQSLVESGDWDVVVLDTPPAAHAEDFLQAPARVRRLFDKRVMGVLTRSRGGLLGSATRRVTALAERIVGDRVLAEIAEFFQLLGGLSGALVDRNIAIDELLTSERCHFLLVTSPAADARRDAIAFAQALTARGMRLWGIAVNRTQAPPAAPVDAAHLPPAPAGHEADWQRFVDALEGLAAQARRAADRDIQASRILAEGAHATVWSLPDLPGGIAHVPGLARLATHLPTELPGSGGSSC